MSVLALITLVGPPDELLAAYDQMDQVTQDVPADGLVSHVAARIDEGLIMADVWESEEQLNAYMSHPDFIAALGDGSLPEPKVEIHRIDRTQ